MMEIDKILPQELWVKILELVSAKDLCRVAAVCSHLHQVVSDPSLWSNTRINKQKLNSGSAELFMCPRYQCLKSLDLSGVKLVTISLCENILKHVQNNPCHLTEVNFEAVTFSNVPAYMLAQIVSNLQKVSFGSTNLSYSQCMAILNQIIEDEKTQVQIASARPQDKPYRPRLTDLNLEMVDLSSIPEDLLSTSITLVPTVNVRRTGLTIPQCIGLFNLITASSSQVQLENLNLRYIDLSRISAQLLAQAISRLNSVVLGFTKLTSSQCTAVLDFLQQAPVSNRCTDLNLCRVNLSRLPADLLASSLTRLKKINLRWTKLSLEQSSDLLSHCLTSTTLTDLNLSNVSLSHIAPDSLAKVVIRLEVAKLWWTNLTTSQVTAILQHSLQVNTLHCLELLGVELDKVDPDIVGEALSRLRIVNLERTRLTTQQCTQLLKRSLTYKTLKEINLCGINLNFVDKHLLVQAVGTHVIYV